MFEIPSNPNIEACIITKATVENGEEPKIFINNKKSTARVNRHVSAKANNDMETA